MMRYVLLITFYLYIFDIIYETFLYHFYDMNNMSKKRLPTYYELRCWMDMYICDCFEKKQKISTDVVAQ